MPKESMNIYLTAVDGMSPVLASITDKTKALDKESQQLNQTYEALQKANKGLIERKTALQKQLQEVNEEVKEARKQFKELGNEASSDAYKEAQEKQQKLRDEIAATTKALQENQKTYKENIEAIRKGGLQDGGQPDGIVSLAKGLFAGQIGQMFSSSLGGAFQAGLTSALGTPTASLISDTLSSAIAGGTAGAMFGPWGIAAGAALGGLSGLISGGTKIYEAKDDAFKEYYNQLIDTYGGLSAGNTATGSAIAAGRETDLISFTTMFGDEEAAKQYLSDLVDMSNRTPFLYDDLTAMSKTLATYGYDENSILPVLRTIGDAGAALGQSTSDMTSVATAIGRMVSSDKASLEYLNILNDRGINAIGYLAEARGKSVADTYSDISKGNISGTEAAEIILAAMEEAYAGSMEAQSKTFAGLTSTLEGLQQEVANAAGEGYNTLRSEAIQTEIDALGGALGDAMKEINTIIGENQARGENLREEYMRAAISAVLLGEDSGLFDDDQQKQLDKWAAEYADAAERYAAGEETAGLEMQALYENAQMMAQAWYDSSEWAQAEVDVQLEQIEAIRQNTYGLAAATDAYRLSQEESKGGGAVFWSSSKIATVAMANAGFDEDTIQIIAPKLAGDGAQDTASLVGGVGHLPLQSLNSHAFGLDRVPYDDYPALLHKDERVLTAGEARAMDHGSSGSVVQITVTGNNFVGTGEEMADQIAEILARKLEQAAVVHQPR